MGITAKDYVLQRVMGPERTYAEWDIFLRENAYTLETFIKLACDCTVAQAINALADARKFCAQHPDGARPDVRTKTMNPRYARDTDCKYTVSDTRAVIKMMYPREFPGTGAFAYQHCGNQHAVAGVPFPHVARTWLEWACIPGTAERRTVCQRAQMYADDAEFELFRDDGTALCTSEYHALQALLEEDYE